MFKNRRLTRAMNWSRKRRQEADGIGLNEDGVVDEDHILSDEEFDELRPKVELERGDLFAMIFSAGCTIMPVAIAVLVLFALFCMFLVGVL